MNKIVWKDKPSIDSEKLIAAQAVKIEELKQACTAAIYKGFKSKSTGFEFGFNELDQQNFTQQALMIVASGGNYNRVIQWKTKSGSVESLTVSQFNEITLEAQDHKLVEQNKYWTLEARVKAATTVEEVLAVNY